jgi:hypothetical protein
MQTPAKGSPVRWRTRRMSPTRAASGFDFKKSRDRAPEGSSAEICDEATRETGSGHFFCIDGFGARIWRPFVCFSVGRMC